MIFLAPTHFDTEIAGAIARYPDRRIRPLSAMRALRGLARDPGNTGHVSRLEIAVGGCSPKSVFARFAATPHGRRVITERRSLVDTLERRDALRALPAATLGRRYLDFVERENLSGRSLMEATAPFSEYLADAPDAVRIFSDYTQRGAHDLYHVLCGYGRDPLGEACVLAMAYEQIRVPGYRVVSVFGTLGARPILREARRIGRQSAWIPGVDLEAALSEDLAALREKLNIGRPVLYDAATSPRSRSGSGGRV